jgi:dienelactone hydrolase
MNRLIHAWVCLNLVSLPLLGAQAASPSAEHIAQLPLNVRSCFIPPPEFLNDFGPYRSPLKCQDGTRVRNTAQWQAQRAHLLATWRRFLGNWPSLVDSPRIVYLDKQQRDKLRQHEVNVEIAPQQQTVAGYLLMPEGQGPFPAVLVVYYDAETGVGLGKELRDFALQLARQGFVALSIGTPEFCSLKAPYSPLCDEAKEQPPLQPLSALAYVAANCRNALANLPEVDANRIGVMGHSYGGKWAMFAACLNEGFACGAWSDPGIVFDEERANVNYWEPWYLGYDPKQQRKRGIPSASNPRTGAYAKLIQSGHDLHELHALMAPRPFLVSGGAEDPAQRWQALNHTREVNRVLGHGQRVALTTRAGHAPTPESNQQIYSFFNHFLRQPAEGFKPGVDK